MKAEQRLTVFNRRILAAGRALAGLSQAGLAKAAGIHLNALQRIEAGGNMRVSTMNRLFAALAADGVEPIREDDGSLSGVRFKRKSHGTECAEVAG